MINTSKLVITAFFALVAILSITACGVNNNYPPIYFDKLQIVDEDTQQTGDGYTEYVENFGVIEDIKDTVTAEVMTLEQLIDNYFKTEPRMGGVAISVFTRDDIILEIEHGYADMEARLAINSDTVFEWGSVTKLLVWVSAMQLYERGELDLHANIFTYIPEEYFPNIRYPITMYHLMNFTSGFDDHYESLRFISVPDSKGVPLLEDVLKEISGEEVFSYYRGVYEQVFPQSWQPGEQVMYSNYAVALAGYVIQRVSGDPFHEYVHINIFAPLGMYRTSLLPDMSDNEWVKEQRERIKIYGQWGLLTTQRRQVIVYPSGGAVGTISDLVKFARALLPDKNGKSVLFENVETLAKLYPSLEDVLNFPGLAFYDDPFFGNIAIINGFMIFIDWGNYSNRIIGHTGSTWGFMSMLIIDIDKGIGIVLSENMCSGVRRDVSFFGELPEILFNQRLCFQPAP